MIKFDFKKNCTGCKACASVCPTKAIDFYFGEDSFWYPHINEKLCIYCDKCSNVCPFETSKAKEFHQRKIETWLYSSDNEEAKRYSSSGAAFYDLASSIIHSGGCVFGSKWNDKLEAVHSIANNIDELRELQGSKYVQSNTEHIYEEVLVWLKTGKMVLFSGVPCQCVAIRNYVELECKDFQKNLLTVGLICHGVPSPAAWDSYKKWIEKKYHSRLKSINFRDKEKEGYKKQFCRHILENGECFYTPSFLPTSKYMEASIVYNLDIRKSCSNCNSKQNFEKLDIVIGDWYSEYKGKGAMGTSCICALSDEGAECTKKALSGLREFDYETIKAKNRYIEESVKLSKNRDVFLKRIDTMNWEKVEKYYPWKYKIKKLFCSMGIYEIVKGKR